MLPYLIILCIIESCLITAYLIVRYSIQYRIYRIPFNVSDLPASYHISSYLISLYLILILYLILYRICAHRIVSVLVVSYLSLSYLIASNKLLSTTDVQGIFVQLLRITTCHVTLYDSANNVWLHVGFLLQNSDNNDLTMRTNTLCLTHFVTMTN